MQRWLEHVSAELGVPADIQVDPLLDAARVVAHSVERRATPLTTYLIGFAAAKDPDADVGAICRQVVELARSWSPEGDSDADGSGG